MATTGLPVTLAIGGGGAPWSDVTVGSIFAVPKTFFPAAAADADAVDASPWSSRPSRCAYRGHLRRRRAGTRTGLRGGSSAEEEGRAVDDVGDSVGSVDEQREYALIVVKEVAVDSRVVVVAMEEAPEASSLFLVSTHRCKWGKNKVLTLLGEM